MSIELIGGGDEFSLLRGCAQNCVDNGGEWYSAPQALAILDAYVGNPALMGDAAFISMAEPERILRLMDQRDDLLAALEKCIAYAEDCVDLPDFKRGVVRAHVNEARAAIAAATGETK
jgi:hypothetical protein